MKAFYSSSFISIILAFLLILGSKGQSVVLDSETKPASFITVQEAKTFQEDREMIRIEAFENLTCPKCPLFADATLPALRELEKETGQIELRLYFIPDINNERYSNAALGLKCAADQGKFWDMLSKIHEKNADLNLKNLAKSAEGLAMDSGKFQECIEKKIHQGSVQEDIQYASEKGIIILPALIIDGSQLVGYQPYENIQRIISPLLRKKAEKTVAPEPAEPTSLQKELKNTISP